MKDRDRREVNTDDISERSQRKFTEYFKCSFVFFILLPIIVPIFVKGNHGTCFKLIG